MQLAGEEFFDQQPGFLWEKLVDLRFAASTIPGLESVEVNEPDHVVCRVRPNLSFLSGKLKLTLQVIEKLPPNRAKMRMSARAIAAGLTVETTSELSPHGEGAKLTWSGEVVEMNGLLKTVSRPLIEAAARKIIADGWTGFRAGLEKERPRSGGDFVVEA